MSLRKDGKPRRHWTLSEETKQKLSAIRKGKKFTEEHKANISKALKGRPSPTKGMKFGPESLRKRSIANAGENNPMFGKKLSDETKKRLSKERIGKQKPPLHGIHVSQARMGISLSNETRYRISENKLGGYWYGNVRYYENPQYCEKFNKDLKERVRAYFGYKCLECGTPQNGKSLHIHHVWYNKKACCDDTPRSLVPLCTGCHNKTLFNRDYWSKHFQDIIDIYYNGKCWFTKDEMKSYNNM